jgi:hypothetical protein
MVESQTKNTYLHTSEAAEFLGSAGHDHAHVTGNPELDDVGEEYLAEAVVRLIRYNPRVRQAILDFAIACSNIRTEF